MSSGDIFQVPLAVRPADPFAGMEKVMRISLNWTLKWLSENEPTPEQLILAALHNKCRELSEEVAKSPISVNTRKLANEAKEILLWIKPDHGKPLNDQGREHYEFGGQSCKDVDRSAREGFSRGETHTQVGCRQ